MSCGVVKSPVNWTSQSVALETSYSVPFWILLFSPPGIHIFSTEIIQIKFTCLILCWMASNSLIGSVQFSSVTQLCLTLCDPMNHSTPGLPVHHQLLEFTQTHVHRVSDAIQPSHPLSSPSPPSPNPSQHQSLFQWVNSSREVAKVLKFQFSIIPSKGIPGLISFRMDWLDIIYPDFTITVLHSLRLFFFL